MRNILVTRLRFMGDVILSTPLLQSIRIKYPTARIYYLTEAPFAPILLNHPDVDEVLVLQKEFNKQIQLMYKLIITRFDVSIDLFGNPRSALLTWLSGARIRIGGNFRGRRLLYTHRIKDGNEKLNAIQYHMRYGMPIDIPQNCYGLRIVIADTEKEWAALHLKDLGYSLDRPIIGLHVGASWPAKKWFPERFAELAGLIHNKLNMDVYFTTGPGEEEIVCSVISQSGLSANAPEVLPVRQLAAVLTQLNVFVSNDCGPMHLAPAVGTPTIGLFGPGEPEIWFPYSPEKGHRVIHHELDCSRCHQDFCEKMECMRSIEVQEVFEAVQSVLKFKSQFQ